TTSRRRLPRQWNDPALGVEGCLPAPQGLQLRAGHLVAGVIAGAYERPRLNVLEAERERRRLHLRELVGVVVALDGQVLEGRPQVLADREDVGVDLSEGVERLGQLVAGLAEPDHQRALGMDGVAVLLGVDVRAFEHAECAIPAGALPDRLLEA